MIVLSAVITTILGRFLERWRKDKIKHSTKPVVFVGIVSYCDSEWPSQVSQLTDTAFEPSRLRFGIVEYVKSAKESRAEDIPDNWRHFVKIHTMSKDMATSQRSAWKTCISEMYDEEEFVLLTRRVESSPGWDILLDSMPPKSVFSSTLSERPSFPIALRPGRAQSIEWGVQEFREESTHFLPSMVCQDFLLYFHKSCLRTILSSDDNIVVSAMLSREGINMTCLSQNIFKKGRVPRGLKRKKANTGPADDTSLFLKSIGIFEDSLTPQAMAGLSSDPTTEECVGKYGSVVAARIRIQELTVKINPEMHN